MTDTPPVPHINGPADFDAWLSTARPGDRCCYYAARRRNNGTAEPLERASQLIRDTGAAVMRAYEHNLVVPVQQRAAPGDSVALRYLAMRLNGRVR